MASGSHYSTCEVRQSICEELVARGFNMVRGGKHWKLFKPNGQFVRTVATTPADCNGHLMFHSAIKRMLRQDGFLPLERDQRRKKEIKMNEGTLTISPQWAHEKERATRPVAVEPQVKHLTYPGDFTDIEKLLKSGKAYADIAVIYKSMGYVHRVKNRPLERININQFMNEHGLRIYKQSKRERQSPHAVQTPAAPTVEAPKPIGHTKFQLLRDVEEIVSSNLNDEKKEKFLQMLFAETVKAAGRGA